MRRRALLVASLFTGCVSQPAGTRRRLPPHASDAVGRKKRSEAILRAERVPILETLPVIEDDAEVKLRSQQEIVRRIIGLTRVAMHADRHAVSRKPIAAEPGDYTPNERAFLAKANPEKDDRVQFSWYYECLPVLLWSVGLMDELDRPERQTSVPALLDRIEAFGRQGLFARAQRRPASEILDEADLIYRYHWATREAQLSDREYPAGLDGEVVVERHRALNWLVRYSDQEWDDVTTDT